MNAGLAHPHRSTTTAPRSAVGGHGIGRVAGIAGIVGPALFTAGWIIGGSLTPGYSHLREPISQIAAVGAPFAWLQQAAFVALGASIATLALGLHRTIRGERWHAAIGPALLIVASVGVVLTAGFQDDPTGTIQQSTSSVLHRATGTAFFFGLIGAAVAFRWRLRRDPAWRGLAGASLASGLVSFALFVMYGAAISAEHPLTGLAQRTLAFSLLTWIIVMAVRLLTPASEEVSRRAR